MPRGAGGSEGLGHRGRRRQPLDVATELLTGDLLDPHRVVRDPGPTVWLREPVGRDEDAFGTHAYAVGSPWQCEQVRIAHQQDARGDLGAERSPGRVAVGDDLLDARVWIGAGH